MATSNAGVLHRDVTDEPANSEACLAKAQECEIEAARARDEGARRTYQYLAAYWRDMAQLTWQFARRWGDEL